MLLLGIILAVVIATYLSALNLSLLSMRRTAVQRRLEQRGNPTAADWLYENTEPAILATALLRTFARMAIYILVLAQILNLHREAMVTWPVLIAGGLIAAFIIWFTTIAIGTSVARHAGAAAIVTSLWILRGLCWLCTPAAHLGKVVDEIVRRLAGAHLRDEDEAEEELLQSIEDVQREGMLDIQSAEILENVVEFTNTEVSEVMTPRTAIEGLELTDDLAVIKAHLMQGGHSRIPVYEESLDHIAGVLYVKDLIPYLGADPSAFKLRPLLRQPIVVPESKPVKELLTDFQKGEVHLAIVIDEYGGTAGLVTIEDVLEEIVGEIRDEHEPTKLDEPVLLRVDERHAEVEGRYRIDELNTTLSLEIPDSDDYDTIAGFVLTQLGCVPIVGESFEEHSVRFKVLAATPSQIQQVGIEWLEAPVQRAEAVAADA